MNYSDNQSNRYKGLLAENKACQFLESLGFEIIERNYRFKRAEIDIIALKNQLLLFVEVKFRKGNSFGHPEEFVTENQQRLIIEAADDYISKIKWVGNIRFDIMATDSRLKIEHFEDAFY